MMFKDPICGMMVDEKKMKFISEFGGIKFLLLLFCMKEARNLPSYPS